MIIKPINYLACTNCGSNVVGKTEKRTQIGQIGGILGLDVTHIWIFLRCCQIQNERIYIREVYKTWVQTKTAGEKDERNK